MQARPAISRMAQLTLPFVALSQLLGCARSEAASNRADSLAVITRTADSLAATLREREAADKKRVADSIAADRVRPRVLALFDNDTRSIPTRWFAQKGVHLASRGDCSLTGRIEAIAGGSKDISVYVFTDDEFVNWKNGGTASALFQSGPKTITNLDVALRDSGRFRVVISNRHAYWTEKAIRADVSARCVGSPTPQSLP